MPYQFSTQTVYWVEVIHKPKSLYGEEINDVFDDVPGKDYMDSIWSDVENARQDISDDPVYVILNLCRVAAFLQSDLVLSKNRAERGHCRISLQRTTL